VFLIGVFPALLSDAPTMSSGHCYEANSPQAGAILVVIGGDLFVDIVCKQTDDSNQIFNSIGNFE